MNLLLTTRAWKLIVGVVVVPFFLLIFIEVVRSFIYVWQSGVGPPGGEASWAIYPVFAWFFAILMLPFLWQYQVGTKLTLKLAAGRACFDRKFRLALIIPLALLFLLILISFIQELGADGLSLAESRFQEVMFFLFLISYLIGFFFRYRQIGRTLHWVDVASNRPPRGNTINLLLALFWWVGIWFLQPRVRAAWAGLQERSIAEHFIEE